MVSLQLFSVPEGGFSAGKEIMAKWDVVRDNYHALMGWDPKTGRLLDETLKKYDLSELIGTF